MGMTIDDVIRYFKDMEKACCCGTEQATIAIDTMCKYQKIQEIVKQKDYDRFNSHNYYGDFLRVQDIRKVIQYGNVD